MTKIFIDSTLKIGGRDLNELADFIAKIDALAAKTDTKFVISVSADEEALPGNIGAITVRSEHTLG